MCSVPAVYGDLPALDGDTNGVDLLNLDAGIVDLLVAERQCLAGTGFAR